MKGDPLPRLMALINLSKNIFIFKKVETFAYLLSIAP